MSNIERYAKFISEQARIAKLDEASKKRDKEYEKNFSLTKIEDGKYHVSYGGVSPGPIATVTHERTLFGGHRFRLDYRGSGTKGLGGREIHDFHAGPNPDLHAYPDSLKTEIIGKAMKLHRGVA